MTIEAEINGIISGIGRVTQDATRAMTELVTVPLRLPVEVIKSIKETKTTEQGEEEEIIKMVTPVPGLPGIPVPAFLAPKEEKIEKRTSSYVSQLPTFPSLIPERLGVGQLYEEKEKLGV